MDPQTCPIGTLSYVVKPGDTLALLAKQFETSIEAILLANPGISPSRLFVGQLLCIAKQTPKKPPCPTANYYVVRPGDRPYSIANSFGIPLIELLRANPLMRPENLRSDDILCIPAAPTTTAITVSLFAKILSFYRSGFLALAYPVAIGKPSTPSPIGSFTLINKQVNPGGPFGTRWLGLSARGYGIHGTNTPSSIGSAASNGCIRMFNEDVNELFNLVPVGTPVRIF